MAPYPGYIPGLVPMNSDSSGQSFCPPRRKLYGPREAALDAIHNESENYVVLDNGGDTVCLDGHFDLATLVRLVNAMSLPIDIQANS